MKRSPASSCSSSYSSSSSRVASESIQKPKAKRNRKTQKSNQGKSQYAAAANSPNKRSSNYRGVTRHRWTGRFEAHLWDKSSWNNIQNKKGKQVYLGAYDNEEAAAHAYDLAALKYWGAETTLNFPIETYTKDIEEMKKLTKEEYLASLRRQSSGFSRGVSKYRGVARHHHNGRWEARIGRVYGNKYLYLGTYNTQEEAAAAYDMAAIEYRGANAVTNFDVSNYIEPLRKKGIPIDQILQEQLLSNNPIDSGIEVEAEIKQPSPPLLQQEQEQEQEQKIFWLSQLQRTQLNSCLDGTSSIVITDPVEDSSVEVEVKQPSPPPPPKEEEEEQKMVSSSQRQCTQQNSCLDGTSPMVITDPVEEHELAWSFCMDSGLNLTMLDLPYENSCELPDLFDHTGFEENIDLMFDTCCYGNEAKPAGYIVETNSTRGFEGIGVARSIDEESEHGKDILLSDSVANSPTCSTTTSVSCYSSV